uniref:CCR4-NOT transcription complex subunit 10 n=1 Tax=Spongospora subterranea TaxID=70186 RepID=A0A0H5R6X3_9EUKA|eukprot:CRZ09502.1 hypothetical protein [Spongospora subterranea]
MAEAAAAAFERRDYRSSLAALMSDPSATKSESRRFKHNFIVTDYLRSGSSDPVALMNSLAALDDPNEYSIDNRAVLQYNRAVLHVRVCEFGFARQLIAPIFDQRLNLRLDIGLSIRIALLLLEIFVRTLLLGNAEKVLEELITMRTQLLSNEPVASSTPIISLSELSFYIYLYQTRLHLLTRNEKSAKKTVKSAMQLLNKESNSSVAEIFTDIHKASALLVKARLECCTEKYVKSIKLLNNVKFSCPRDPVVSAVYLNNLGCLHFAMNRFTAAAFYFRRALAQPGAETNCSLGPRIRFNCGMQRLHSPGVSAIKEISASASFLFGSSWIWIQLGLAAVKEHALFRSKDSFATRSHDNRLNPTPRVFLKVPSDPPQSVLKVLQRGYSFFRNGLSLSPSASIIEVAFLGIAYICLCLSRFSEAINWLSHIKPGSALDSASLLLARLYRCEALCGINRIKEGMASLFEVLQKQNDPGPDEDMASLFASLCSVQCLSNNYKDALSNALKAHAANVNDIVVLRDIMFLLLRFQAYSEAVYLLYHRTPPNSLPH